MRTLLSRTDWAPTARVEGLRRVAFIGDSTVFGEGVRPDETLPAATERHLNEMFPGQPTEAVNFGVPGYNLWNAWLSFKNVPQVYDGLVVTLCNNDAEMFSLTFKVNYPDERPPTFLPDHPVAASLAACLEDIALFCRQHGLRVAVCFITTLGKFYQDIVGPLAGLCAAQGLTFIDAVDYLLVLDYPTRDLIVSELDSHPSALAHDTVGRFVASTMRRSGWFAAPEPDEVAHGPARVVAAARSMIERDMYPADSALNWASRALEAQTRGARRMQLASPEGACAVAATDAAEAVSASSRFWHVSQRMRAMLGAIAMGGHGICLGLVRAEDLIVQLQELEFGLRRPNWNDMAADLGWPDQKETAAAQGWEQDGRAFLQDCDARIAAASTAASAFAEVSPHADLDLPGLRATFPDDHHALLALLGRVGAACRSVSAAFDAAIHSLEAASPWILPAARARAESLFAGVLAEMRANLSFIERLPAAIELLGHPALGEFVTIEMTVSTHDNAGRRVCVVLGKAEYGVPSRMPFTDRGKAGLSAEGCTAVSCVPLFYAGRVAVSIVFMAGPTRPPDMRLERVEVSIKGFQRRVLKASAFQQLDSHRYLSPMIYLV